MFEDAGARPLKISVIGTGYLGTTHAAAMAELGHQVIGVDADADKVTRLQAGVVPFFEPGLGSLVRKHVEDGTLQFSTSVGDATAYADVHFVCVGTPQSRDGEAADLSYVDAAFEKLTATLRPGAVVVGKSTVPPGTAARLAPLVEAAGGELVWNPEFLREGRAIVDTLRPDRIVLGVDGPRGLATMETVYADALAGGAALVVTDYTTAELVKLAANSFLATKISFINVMAELCEAAGADVRQLSTALGYDPRIGRAFLDAGVGFGGSCLPKDIRGLRARATELGVQRAAQFLHCVDAVNEGCRSRMVALARDACGGRLAGRRVGVLGAAFKPDSDDVRDSPALRVAGMIHEAGADVCVHDPQAMTNAKNDYPDLQYAPTPADACADADVVLHLTEWSHYRELDPVELGAVVRQRTIIDGRNALDPARWRAAGWTLRTLGAGAP
jgi:UDPglucose 6-dehydrogenase